MRSHPYRHAEARAAAPPGRTRDPEATIIYAMLMVLGVTRLALAVALGEAFAAEATVAAVLVVAAIAGFARGR